MTITNKKNNKKKNIQLNKVVDKKNNKKDEFKMANELAMILSSKRATNYNDWIKVGWALYSVDDSKDMLNVFKKFSKKTNGEYSEKSCEKVWKKANKEGLTIGSLKHWAKEDNPKKYNKIIKDKINKLLDLGNSGTEYDIAVICFYLYSDNFRCTSIKPMNWYMFQGHKWVDIDDGSTLRVKLSTELTKQFSQLGAEYFQMMQSSENPDLIQNRIDRINKLIRNLKKREFKNKIISECADIFYNADTKFLDRLDSNKYLIGFENGVYDLKVNNGIGEFRKGRPNDWISLSTGYKWKEYNLEHHKVQELIEYFSQVQTDKDMRDYLLTLLASYLDGYTKLQQFIIWTGSGSNGKSTTTELFKNSFGEYYGTIPVSLLTKKRSDVGKATPELANARGKRFIIFSEPDGDDQIQVGLMKELTGGEEITVRPLYKNSFTYKPQYKLVLACNKLPDVSATDNGTWRRIRVLAWESKFVDEPEPQNPKQFKRDYDLVEKLEKWKGAFMWYLLKVWYPLYINQGLKEPPKVTQFTSKYKKQSDVFYEFMGENIKITGNKKDKEQITILYGAFKNWYVTSHSRNKVPFDKKDLAEYFENNGFKYDKKYIYGIVYGLSDDESDDQDN